MDTDKHGHGQDRGHGHGQGHGQGHQSEHVQVHVRLKTEFWNAHAEEKFNVALLPFLLVSTFVQNWQNRQHGQSVYCESR
jgi:hypothetical protein